MPIFDSLPWERAQAASSPRVMHTAIRRVTVAVLLALSVACGDSGPTSPTTTRVPPVVPAPSPSPNPPPPPPSPPFPTLSGPSRTFTFARQLSYPVSNGTQNSSFVLYDNGAFVLRYEGPGYEYPGGYTERDGEIGFGWAGDERWGATGKLEGDTLTVRYNEISTLTDFQDAVYVLTR